MALKDRIMAMSMEEAAPAYAFAAPPGFTIPDEVEEGQPFEVVAKIRMDGGQLVFDEINGLDLTGAREDEPEYEDEESVETEEIETEEPEMDLMGAAKASGY